MRRPDIARLPKAARKMTLGIISLILVTYAGSAYGILTSAGRVDPEVRADGAQASVDVLVVLDFKPEAFHMRQLQTHGSVGAVTAAGVELRRVAAVDLDALARTAWISAVQPLREGR